jgi:DNA-binding beta-propeller fold protein YncE
MTVSTIPTNGDVNPYGVAFVPKSFPAGGFLNPGDILVSNFNNAQNLQGTGTTIIRVTPAGQTSLFFQGTPPLGLSTGLAVLEAGFVLVANCPTNNAIPVPGALPGTLLLLDSKGNLVQTFVSPFIQGPWDLTVDDQGNHVRVFVSNSITDTISRLDLVFNGSQCSMQGAFTIASGYTHHADPATFEVSPTGLAFDRKKDVLYVASTGDNTVFAVRNATRLSQSNGQGQALFSVGHLHGALAMVLAPNGHLLINNSDEFNPSLQEPSAIDEYTVGGQFIGQIFVDPNQGGAFGLNIADVDEDVVRFAAVDDNQNTLTIWTLNMPE